MKIYKIPSRYCLDNQVLISFPINSTEIICSKEGYLFLKNNGNKDNIVNKYKDNPLKDSLPQINSTYYNMHILKFDTVYVHFNTNLTPGFRLYNTYELSFLYLKQIVKGECIMVVFSLTDFFYAESDILMDTDTLENFLRDDYNTRGKYIFDRAFGICHAKVPTELINIYTGFLDLKPSSIINKYNYLKHSFPYIYGFFPNTKNKSKLSVNNLEDLDEFELNESNPLKYSEPYTVTITENEIIVNKFKIFFLKPNEFRVSTKKYIITKCKIYELLNRSKIPYNQFEEYYKE